MAKAGRAAKTGDPMDKARERLAREKGAVVKGHSGAISIALAYPNSYEVGMSNLGFHKVYSMLNAMDGVVCERVFLPDADDERYFIKRKTPLFSLESQKPLNGFDAAAFSITFEADYINVLKMLRLGKIPLKGRGPRDPLILAGGICPTMNPEVLGPFFDIMVIGEGEDALEPIIAAMRNGGKNDLAAFARIPGVYVPSAYTPVYENSGAIARFEVRPGFPEKVKRLWNHGFSASPNVSVIDTPDTVFGGMALVEIGKGCGKHCRFCAAGYVYRPTRHADTSAILAAVDAGLSRIGRVGLVGSAVGDHPDIEKIFSHIVEKGGEFSVSSFRLDKLTPTMLENLAKGGAHTITVAPEAGSERLRKRINKDLGGETIIRAARMIAQTGPFNMKLYFLVGFPGETVEDVAQIASLAQAIRDEMISASKTRGTMGHISVGVDVFVPKPFTPFAREPFIGIAEADRRLKLVKKMFRALPGVSLQAGSARQSYVQALLSVGDRRVAEVIEKALEMDGDWFGAMRESPVDADFFATRRKGPDEILPWDMIDSGLYEGYLEKEMERRLDEKLTPECPPPGSQCQRCGAFDGVCVIKGKTK
ncbi:MAG: radical SAM protein [Nitrospinae bacterium]|nr:radical SAM protein [Nitrospinota bacterium]